MKKKKTGTKRAVAHRWTFQSEAEIEVVALAQLGQTNRRIERSTGIANGSITYILGKSKRLEGYEKHHTYRSEWRDGSGKLVKQVIGQVLPQLKEQAADRLPKLITHPTPKVAPEKPDERPIA